MDRAPFAFLLFALILAGLAPFARGFVVEGPRTPTPDALERLERAPRWAPGSGSLVATGERSLAGGLEYSIDESLCTLRLVDGSTCLDVRASIRAALTRWSDGHPSLFFVDVSRRIEPAVPFGIPGRRGQGAEIDFFATQPSQFPPFQIGATHGYTIFYTRPVASLTMTNGATVRFPDGIIESADVRVNAARCYYLDAQLVRPDCVHLPTLLLHEIGHTLGIGHPEQDVAANLDTDTDPTNAIPIDCRNPLSGLRPSPGIDEAAVAIGRNVEGPERWLRGLTYDDIAARDALYPDCGIRYRARTSEVWGAYAVSPYGATGQVSRVSSPDVASQAAARECGQAGRACRVLEVFDGCFAHGVTREGLDITATSPREAAARDSVLVTCARSGTTCRIFASGCSVD